MAARWFHAVIDDRETLPLAAQLAAFNLQRRALLGDRPIDPSGEYELMSEEEKDRMEGR